MRPVVFDTMGTTVSLTLPSGELPDGFEAVFSDADQRFSLYRPDSELSRLARQELTLIETSETMRNVYALANDWRSATGGAFTAHRPDGIIDLSGVVKAWAMAQAESLMDANGLRAWCLNVGGDVSTRGVQANGSPWTAGIVDPFDRGRLLAAATISDARGAIATSGSSERGDHIWRLGHSAAARFAQATVAAPSIVMADVLATAIVAAGPDGLAAITEAWPIDVLAVLADGSLLATPGMRASVRNFGRPAAA